MLLRRLSRHRLQVTAVLVIFSVLALGATLSVWHAPLHNYGGTADVEQKMWFFTWLPFALGAHHNPLVSTYLNYPRGINLMWNTMMPALALAFAPVTVLGGAILTYNVIATLSIALAGTFAYIAIRRYVAGGLAAFIGAAIFAFSPAMMAQSTGHLSPVVSCALIPLVLLLLDELLVRQHMHPGVLGVLVGLLGVAQFLIYEEFFFTDLGAMLLIAIILGLIYHDQVGHRLGYVARVAAVAVPVTVVILAYPVYVQLRGPERPPYPVHDPDGWSTDLLNLVVPTSIQRIAPPAAQSISSRFLGNLSEWNGYLGIPLLLLLVTAGFVYRRVVVVRVAALAALAITILSLGPHLHVNGHQLGIPLPYWPLGKLPLVRSALPARLMFFTFLAAGIVVAFVLHDLWRRRRRNAVICALLAGAVIAPLVPVLPLPHSTLSVPHYFTSSSVRQIPDGTPVLMFPWPGEFSAQPLDWQVAAHMRFRMLGGYFFGPPSPDQTVLQAVAEAYSGPVAPPDPDPGTSSLFVAQLHDNDVGAVVVGPVTQQAAAITYLTRVLARPPDMRDGVAVWLLTR